MEQTDCLVGWGIHSLRAASQQECKELFTHFDNTLPFHLHLSEQRSEVADCLKYWGVRPTKWACDNLPLNEFSSLIHCTHLDDDEIKLLSEKKCNIVLCPSTEANLGDGFFPLAEFKNAQGSWSIGSDSHINLSPFEELRWLEYQVRLQQEKRNPLCSYENEQSGDYLVSQAFFNGHLAMATKRTDYFEIGHSFDAIGITTKRPNLKFDPQSFLSQIVYLADDKAIDTVITAGKTRVEQGAHIDENIFMENYSRL